MAYVIHDEGLEALLEMLFGDGTQPTAFFIGLCDEVLAQEDALADIATEPSGNGYSRQQVAAGTGVSISKDVGTGIWWCEFDEVTFTADGGAWPEVTRGFVATSSDNSGLLICSGDIQAIELGDGSRFKCTALAGLRNPAP
jgi:hypothetical protein